LISARQKKVKLAHAFLAGRPLLCTWQLGRCSETHCLFCEQRAELGGEPWPDDRALARILEELDTMGALILVLEVGADGLARPTLPDLVTRAARRHFVAVASRGWVCPQEAARRLWEAGAAHVTIELETADPTRNAARLGWQGVTDKAVACVRTLASERRRTSQVAEIRIGVGPGEVNALAQVLESLEGVAGVAVTVEPRLETQVAAAATRSDGLGAALLELKKRFPVLASPTGFLRRVDVALQEGIPDCGAGRRFLHVDHRGRVSRCNRYLASREALGSLTEDGTSKVMAHLAERSNDCRDCWSPVRGELEALRSWRGVLDGIGHLLRR
jgi:MoaA/NifB/PqqE/SkfB family radical SAM enzyme